MEMKLSETKKNAFLGLFGVVLLVFLAANVVASQLSYAPLMFRLVGLNDIDAAREFLVNLDGPELAGKGHSGQSNLYESQSRYLNSHFDNIFAREVDISQLNAEKAIAKYEELLQVNEYNPQVLVKLGLLHREKGDEMQAAEYFKRARNVDPWVDIE